MNELDEANLDKQLREKLEPHGRQPSAAVWGKINQRINQPATPAATVRPWVWFAAFMGGILLLLIGNQLPKISGSGSEIALIENPHTVNQSSPNSAEVTAANPSKTIVSGRSAQPANLAHANSGNPNSGSAGVAVSNSVSEAHSLVVQSSAARTKTPVSAGSAVARNNRETPLSGRFAEVNPATTQTQVIADKTELVENAVKADANPAQNATGNATGNTIAAPTVPAILHTLVTLEQNLQPLLSQNPETAQSANQVAENLQAQIAELSKLKHRADNLLAIANNSEYLKPLPVASHKTEFPNNAPSRWSAALAFAPERSFMTLSAPASDSLLEMRKKHESGREGYNASLTFDYQLNDRLSIGAGVGLSSYGVELPVTEWQTLLNVVYDTTQVINYQVGSSTSEVMTIRHDTVYQLEPVLNDIGQVISYDSIPIISSDTTTFTIIVHDSLEIINTTLTPLISKTEVATYKVLKTDYNFFTLPVNLRYRLTPGNRWWADVGVGAQLQLFRGGSQVITRDGNHYETRKINAKEGPFRPVNLALTGSLALNYALSPRLSVSVAPAVRWQTLSVYKKETGLKQQPFATGLQFGIRFAL